MFQKQLQEKFPAAVSFEIFWLFLVYSFFLSGFGQRYYFFY